MSFVLPAFCESENLNALIPRILEQASLVRELEVIVVDDHSSDQTFQAVREWSRRDPRILGLRLARNSGSHMAILCGLSIARGDAVVILAADGQDPPELAATLLERWSAGAQVVWAVRARRPGVSRRSLFLSRAYYAMMNRFSSVRLPPSGADFFLVDRRVADVLKGSRERNTSIFALISWLGFRQVEVPYVKESRLAGRSKWTLRKRIRLLLDSLFGFSVAPLRLATGVGFFYALAGFLYAFLLITNKVLGGLLFGALPIRGWSALMVVLLFSAGTILIILGVLGEYLWRTLEEVRERPRFSIEDTTELPPGVNVESLR